ncbi:hypothetical protein D9M71_386400 [compost metagenome]
MVDLHAVGHGGIHPRRQHRIGARLGQLARHVERTGGSAKVTDGMGCHADAERWHHVIKEAVEMVRREQDDQFRRKVGDLLTSRGDHVSDLGQHDRLRIEMPHQWRVRQALQIGAHDNAPCPPTPQWLAQISLAMRPRPRSAPANFRTT